MGNGIKKCPKCGYERMLLCGGVAGVEICNHDASSVSLLEHMLNSVQQLVFIYQVITFEVTQKGSRLTKPL